MHMLENEDIIPSKEELIKKIKEADSKYYKESPCMHCGPGNGCDDCRGCEDAKKNWELDEERRKAYEEFKKYMGYSYEQECDYKNIIDAENNYNKFVKLCQSCHGNFGDDCRYCEEFDNSYKALQGLKWAKNEYKRKYNIEYDPNKNIDGSPKENINSKSNMKECNIIDISKSGSIDEWINNNVKKMGAQEFYNEIGDNWKEINKSILDKILSKVSLQIKPEKIETIKDVAALLNGNEYGKELDNPNGLNIRKICKENKWIIIYPYSDDCMEIEGYISDEIGAGDGDKFKLIKPGEFYEYGEDCGEPIYKKSKDFNFIEIDEDELKSESLKGESLLIEALWCQEDSDLEWKYLVWNAPYVTFGIGDAEEDCNSECVVIDISKFVNE